MRTGYSPGSIISPFQWAGKDRLNSGIGQVCAKEGSLISPIFVKANIGTAAKNFTDVPFGLAVSYQDDVHYQLQL